MRCGVGDYTRCLAESLADRSDISLRVLTTVSAPSPDGDPPWLHRRMANWRLTALGPYLRLLREFQPDIVHIQYPTQGYSVWSGPAALPAIARIWGGSSVVQTWHEYPNPAHTREGRAQLVMAAAADALLFVRPDFPDKISGVLSKLLGRAPRHFVPNASTMPVARLRPEERLNIRSELGIGARQLVAFFGFAYPHKGVEQLFRIADPKRNHIVLIGELREEDPYHAQLLSLAASPPWRGNVTVSGFATSDRVARILAAADAAIFPFVDGGGIWSSSVHAAVSQGTFTILTSRERAGYAADENVYYAPPGAIVEMRGALDQHIGVRRDSTPANDWNAIALRHIEIYRKLPHATRGESRV